MIKQQALAHLRAMTNKPSAEFHDGQLEAIVELAVNNRQMLVVQKTGWGKSAVYFIATNHDSFKDYNFPKDSIVIDPWRIITSNKAGY